MTKQAVVLRNLSTDQLEDELRVAIQQRSEQGLMTQRPGAASLRSVRRQIARVKTILGEKLNIEGMRP